MKTDDPRITAYALDALAPADRAEIERDILSDPAAAAEVAETRDIAGILKTTLHAEVGAPLTERQRDTILRAASLAGRGTPTNETNILTHPAWWNRVGVWQAIAACAVFGFGVYAISQQLTKPGRAPETAQNSDIRVGLPQPGAVASNNGTPDTRSPDEKPGVVKPVTPDIARATPPGPGPIRVTPDVGPLPERPPGVIANTQVQPTVIEDVNPNDFRVPKGIRLEGADIGIAAKRDAEMNAAINARLKEAASIAEGTTLADFEKTFRADASKAGRYEMIRMPVIKVDAEFDGAKLRKVSQPYVEPRK